MTNKLIIHNFKCFKHAEFILPNLTVLVGANGMGKSTVIQSLLLMRSAFEDHCDLVRLNGPYGLFLGTNTSVLNQEADSDEISLTMTDDNNKLLLQVEFVSNSQEEILGLERKRLLSDTLEGLRSVEFYFLAAERTGPRVAQKIVPLEFLNTGIYGEHAGQILADRYLKIDESRQHASVPSPYLLPHVNAWLNEIVPGAEVIAEQSMSMQTCQIRSRNRKSMDFVESTNIGFGISYALPIIIQGLIASKGSFFIVENPEAHLHPAAQTAMGKFLAMISNCGVRVIIETHSDHLLDGIQLYSSNYTEMHKDIVIYYFGLNEEQQHEIRAIRYDEDFDYTEWPKGFMDQTNINYKEFIENR